MAILSWIGLPILNILQVGKEAVLASHAVVACCKQLPCIGNDAQIVLLY